MNTEFEETTINKRAYLMTAVLSVLSMAAFLMLVFQLVTNETTAVPTPLLVGVWLVGLLAVASTVGAWYCRNGRVGLGLGIVGASFLLLILAVPFITKGRVVYAAPLTVALAIAVVPQLFPLRVANRVVSLFVAVGIIAVALDAWLPIERVTPAARPYAIFAFLIALFIFIVYAATQYRQFRLQTKLLAFLVFLPLLIITVTGAYFITRISGQQQVQVQDDIQVSLQDQAGDIVKFIGDAEADIHLLGSSFALENYLLAVEDGSSAEAVAAAKTTLQETFIAFAQTRLIYDQIRFIDANGQEIVRVDTDKEGVSSVIAEAALQNKADRPYFTQTLQKRVGEIYISPLELNVENGEIERPFTPVLRYGIPVYWYGQLKGIVVTNILADYFLDSLAAEGQTYYLLDQDGYFLFHPDAAKQWGRDLQTGIVLGDELPDVATSLQMRSPGSQTLQTQTTLYSYTPIILQDETAPRWVLLNATTNLEVLAPVNRALEPVQYVLAVALMLTPLIALFVSQSIASPIVRLSEAAEQMRRGNFEVPIEVSSNDEVGVLAGTLRSMTVQLGDLIGSLEARVSARTRDLTLAVDVSNQVSQVQTLDALLFNAVNLIRERFDLYYTQIYLVDGKVLRLEAGTGEVGQKLQQQGHMLIIGPGSINGTAVSEKRSLIVPDTSTSTIFRPNPLLPNTRSEMSVPLIAKEKVVGVLNLQSAEPNALTEENLFAFEALAGQLASAIENARLFAEVVEARSAVEAQMNRLTRQGWDAYLDGIHNREVLGYAYEAGKVTAVSKSSPAEPNYHHSKIQMLDEEVGQIAIAPAPDKPFTPAEIELVHIVSRQVGQQIENLRLLADARRYQQEAEDIANRLVRDGWIGYQEDTAVTGFVYDQQKVSTLAAQAAQPATPAFVHPLAVGKEAIGEIVLDELAYVDEPTREIVRAVSAQLSTHIENLRLAERSERARADAEKRSQEISTINSIVTRVAASLDLQHSLQIIVDELVSVIKVDQVRIALIQPESNTLLVIAEHYDQSRTTSAVGMSIPLEGNELTQQVIKTRHLVVVEDAQNNPQTAPVHDLFKLQGIETVILLPLVVNDEVIGTIGLDILDKRSVEADSLKLAETIVYQAATAIQNARLFDQSQAALAETETLYAYSSQLNTSTSLDAVLESATAPGFQVGAVDAMMLIYDQDANEHPKYGRILAAKPKRASLQDRQVILRDQPLNRLWPEGGKNILFVGDISEDDRVTQKDKATFAEMDIHAVAILFLLVGNLRLGQIIIRWNHPQTFTTADERLYGAIAQQASSVVYNRLLFNQTEEALSETAALYQASADLNTAQTFDQVLTSLRRHTVLGERSFNVNLNYFDRAWEDNNPPNKLDVLARWSTIPPEKVKDSYSIEEFPDAIGWLFPDKPTLCEDLSKDDRLSPKTKAFFNYLNVKAFVVAPLVTAGQWVGIIASYYPEPMTFSDAKVRQLTVLVRQAAVSIQTIRLLEQTNQLLSSEQRQRQIASTLLDASNRFAGTLSEDELRQVIVEQIDDILRPDHINFFEWQPFDNSLKLERRFLAAEDHGEDSYKLGQIITANERPELLAVVQNNESLLQSSGVAGGYLREHYVLPWLVGSEVAGVLEIFHTAKSLNIREEDQLRCEGVVRQASIAIQNARLYEQTQSALAETEALYEGSAHIIRSLSEEDILQGLIFSTALKNLDRANIFLFDHPIIDEPPGDVTAVAVWEHEGVEKTVTVGTHFPVAQVPFISLLRREDTLVISDIMADSRIDSQTRAILESYGMRGFVIFPMVVGNQWLGMVSGQSAEPFELDEEQLRRANSLVSQAAVVLQTTVLFRQEQARARREQLLREIAAKVRSSADVDTIMRTAVTEIGRTLGRRAFIKLGNGQPGSDEGANGAT